METMQFDMDTLALNDRTFGKHLDEVMEAIQCQGAPVGGANVTEPVHHLTDETIPTGEDTDSHEADWI